MAAEWLVGLALLVAAGATAWAPRDGNPPGGGRPRFGVGADVSMLPEIEAAGGKFRRDGGEGDAIEILREHGVTLFRLRLFVDPDKDFNRNYGATQDLAYITALAERVKATGSAFLLDLHYSDTWADPGKQFKPSAWEKLDFEALERRVYEYTAEVLKHLGEAGAMPDLVQVGNEVAGGMLWPEGKVLDAEGEEAERQWKRLARLLNAGARAVREAGTNDHPVRVVLHIHGGGRPGLPQWFFDRAARYGVDYDVAALSFYPAFKDALEPLKKNMAEVIEAHGKDVLIVEASYPWRPLDDLKDDAAAAMVWPQSPEGQERFMEDLAAAVKAAPQGRGLGVVWWYPEAIPVPADRHIWRGGAEALFDQEGRPLPALKAVKSILGEKAGG